MAERKAGEQRLRLIERLPFPGDCHPLEKSDLEVLLRLVPAEMLHGLRSIELRPRNHAVGAPFAQYRAQSKTVILYSLPLRWEFETYHAGLAVEVSRAGATVTRHGKRMKVAWSDDASIRLWYFFDVLGHELGHHFDFQFAHKNGISPNTRSKERFAELASRKLRDRAARLIRQKRANKAPEPTPGAVTPRATEGASK